MPLDDPAPQPTPEASIKGDEWDGSWGSISPVARSVETLCVQMEIEAGKPRIYYYPYRTIGKWNWSMGEPEVLEIQTGSVHLTISGTGLRRLSEALNMGQLRRVQLTHCPAAGEEICIRNILFDETRP